MQPKEPLTFSTATSLSGFFPPTVPTPHIQSGSVEFHVNGSWQSKQPMHLKADVDANMLDGSLQDIIFEGASLKHSMQVLPVLRSHKQCRITADKIGKGVIAEHIDLALQLGGTMQNVEVHFKEGSLELFGGKVRAAPFQMHSAQKKARIQLFLESLDLARMVPLQKVKGLQVAGLVDGSIPLNVGAKGVIVKDGTITQHGPGTIAYQPNNSGSLKSSGIPEMVIKALEDFQYKSLLTRVDYQPDGRLDLAIQLQGVSPHTGSKRPIHINLNVEQNLLSLLKSLSYSGVVNKQIEKQVKKQKQP